MPEVEEKTAGTQETTAQPEKTFTQTELDAIIGDRLKREREKYADYEQLKEKAGRYDAAEEASKSELQKATEKAESLQKQLDALVAENTRRSVREKIATEKGVPANLLSGDTEEDCRKQADAILEFAKPAGYPKVKDGGEALPPTNAKSGSTNQQFADWFNQNLTKN